MSSNPTHQYPMQTNNPLVSWELVAIKVLLLITLLVMLAKPTGSISGRLALEQPNFNLYSFDMREHHVYAIAIGPRGDQSQERGVWVNHDGTFKIDGLPVGEYELKVHVPGFATTYDSGIFVEEGKTTALNRDIVLELIDPSVNMASNTRVFTTKERPRFWINATGCSQAVVKVYSQDMLKLWQDKNGVANHGFEITPDMGIYKPYDTNKKKTAQDFFNTLKPVKTWTRNLDSDSENTAHAEFKFDEPMPRGDYFAVVEVSNAQNKTDWNVTWFSVSDVGLIVKNDPWQTLVRAIDLNTLRPISNVDVQVFMNQGSNKALNTGKTGADGFVKFTRSKPMQDSGSLLAYGLTGTDHAYGGMNYYHSSYSDSCLTYFYTERPVYRLGQTVYFKGIARRRSADGALNPGGNLKLKVKIEDPDNNEVWSGNLKTTDHGSFNGVFGIPNEGKTGAYQVTFTYPDGVEDTERFEVAEYRKPEYQVEVTPLAERVTAGTKAKARVKATYYFGAPVAGAKVKYTIYSAIDWYTRYSLMDRPSYYGYFDDWEEDDYVDSSYSGDYVSEGVTTTDANGEAIVEFDTKRSTFDPKRPWEYDTYDHKYRVEAEVTDMSRLSVVGSGSEVVTNGEFELFVKPAAYVAKVGEPINAEVRAVSYAAGHKPMANLPVHVQLYRRLYDRVHYEYKGVEVLENATVTTDSQGNAKVSFQTKPKFVTDNYEILATAVDSGNNTIADDSSIWVVSENSPYYLPSEEAAKEPLTVKLDKQIYKPGETAKIMITAPVTGVEGAQAIVSVEGPKLYSYKVVDLTSTGQMIELPIASEYAPNVYVTVTFIGNKHQYYNQSQMIKVSPQEHFLNLTVESDKAKYKPGETAVYTVKAKYADGKPAANTEVSLGVVDESIYAVRSDTTPDIKTFFYSKRSNDVTTTCSFLEQYSGGPDKVEPQMRKDFRDTAAWLPNLITDKDGLAKASIKLPDNLTTWRATAVGITTGTDVGMTRQKITVTQDLILRLAMPRFFSQGDKGFITAVVHNYTDKVQPVELTLNVSNQFKLKDNVVQKLVVEPDKAKRFCWATDVLAPGEAVISCKAIGATAGDAMQIKLPVRPLGVQSFVTKSGVITADDATIDIPSMLPPDAVKNSAKLHVYLSPSMIGSLAGNFSTLIDYPYGCTEQTMSKLMPSIVAVKMSKVFGVPLSAADSKKFKEVYKQSMTKLDGYQHDDGGWGWWATDDSQIYLTALVLDGYKMLESAGFAVETDRKDRGMNWLSTQSAALVKQLSDPMLKRNEYTDTEHAIDLSRAYYVLSKYGQKVPEDAKTWAVKHKDKMTPESLAYLTMALTNSKEPALAKSFYNRLIELANGVTGDFGATMDWAPSTQMYNKLGFRDRHYSYRYTDVETTALALEAVAAMEPDNSDRLENIKRWIMLQRGKDGWDNTKTTSEVFKAFMQVEGGANKAVVSNDYEVELTGSGMTPWHFTKANSFDKEKDVLLTAKSSGGYSIHKKGPGKLYYTSVLTYYKAIKPGEYVAQKAMPYGLKLRREFFKLIPSKPDSDGNIHFTAEPLPNRTVRAGETILMKVYIEAPTTLPYVIVEAPLPSGAEVVKNDEREYAKEESDGSSQQHEDPYSFGSWWWTHQDIMDDHMAFFVTDFNSGKSEMHQMIRMEIPGKFEMNPVTLEGMYTKGVRGYSQADEITVTE